MIETAVYSLWSKPYKAAGRVFDAADLRMLALSVLLARGMFKRLVLFCDAPFERLATALPFDEMHGLDVPRASGKIWALGKLTAYAEIGEPFVHIDHDAFLFKPLTDRMLDAAVIAERPEVWTRGAATDVYNFGLSRFYPEAELRAGVSRLPDGWEERLAQAGQRAYCAGILGGNDTAGLAAYARKSLVVAAGFEALDGTVASVFLEQFALGVEFSQVETLLPSCFTAADAAQAGFCHLIGSSKRQPFWQRRVSTRLNNLFPLQAAQIDAISIDLAG